MGGIARLNKMIPVIIGGDVDHSHTVIKLPTTLTIAKGIQVIKAGSSKWVHETYPAMANFAWQVGYGAFSISSMNLPSAIAYVRQQEEHHKKISFKDEYLGILKKHGVAIDERYIWD